MKLRMTAKIGSLALAACIAFSSLPVFADGEKQITVRFEDVTATDTATQYGEAKIKVSISGANGDTTVVQNAFTFDGMDYKSARFLKGENEPPAGVWYAPTDISAVNTEKKFTLGIASEGIAFGDDEEVYIVTFSGEPGDEVTLSVAPELENTYCMTDGEKITVSAQESGKATASEKGNQSAEAVVKLTMDKVPGFNAAADTGITLRITSETTKGYVITNTVSNKPVQENGHRESTDIPTFTIKNSVLGGDAYTVELFGAGYVAYKKTGVTFDKALEITNAEFIPGDVNGDGKIDADDKTAAEKSQTEEFNEAADFDRNGKTDSADMAVFEGISDKAVPAKMSAPTLTGGSKKITVKWTKPSDESVTGYTVKYGTSKDKLTSTKEIDKASTVSTDITGLSANTTYYVQIAAKNDGGTGEYSEIASVKTDSESSPGGGNGGGGGNGNGGGYTPSAPGNTANPSKPNTTESTEIFTDLENHAWAKDSIYALKNKGIISGISEIEFAPANNIKRGDFILILTRMLGVNDEFTENFADVPESTYYYNAIGSAKAAGIAQGSGENFMPENSITRQDLITLAYRAFLAKGYIEETGELTSLEAFADMGDISEYAKTAMASMVSAGIIKGSNGNVNPKGNATRAEVAVMCARLVELMK
mgnify:CR=1 FL=1